ncbi:MAG: ATP-binding protein, partial [Candidatus Aenigmarchaeota archaeon]|nr:ATP-binding protein [Candidatus Aenigmarchaeota archaeon]
EEAVKRELEVPQTKNKIVSIIGPRRSGKTYYFYQLLRDRKENSLYLNFEDTRLFDTSFKEIRDVIRIFIEETGKVPESLFFDEIQNVEKWEIALRELLDTRKYYIFVTGSSSRLLAKEVATQLRGRTFSYLLLPFNFREFLAANKVETKLLTADEAAKIKNFLLKYLEFGGFPEVTFEEKEKERILKEYYEMILFKDIIERHRIKNINVARFILAYLIENFSKEISINRMISFAKVSSFGKNTVYSYVDKVQDSVAVFFVDKFSRKVHVRKGWPKKVYVCDPGLSKVLRFSEDIGKLMENCVFLDLLRSTNKNPLLEIFYFKDYQQNEVDFVLKQGLKVNQLIQVTYSSSKDEIEKREIKSLIKASNLLKCKNLLVITWDYEDQLKIENKKIVFKPLWKWLLLQ